MNSLLSRYAWLAIPHLEDDDERRAAPLLQLAILIIGSLSALGVLFGLTIWNHGGDLLAISLAISTVLCFAELRLLAVGRYKWAANGFLGGGYLVCLLPMLGNRGLVGGDGPALFVMIALAGLIRGRNGAIVAGIATLIAGVAVTLVDGAGMLVTPMTERPLIVAFSLQTIFITVIIALADHALRQALAEARHAAESWRKSRDEVMRTSKTLDNVIRSMADGLVLTDGKGTITGVNPSLEELTGRLDLVGQPVSALLGAMPKAGETQLLDVDGTLIDVAVSRGELSDEGSKSSGSVWVVRDTRHRKEAERRLRDAVDASEAANRQKSQFLANMSHELRTPLNAIIGYAEMMREDLQDPQAKSDLQKIEGSGKHLLSLVNDVLDISKIEAGKMEIHHEAFDVANALRDMATTVGPLMEKNRNRLVLEIPADIGVMRSDLVRVRQVLFNLLSNAAKFTQNGTVTLGVARAGGDMEFTVADTGIGLSSEVIERLFRPFSQADASTTRKYGGTGLGLALVRHFSRMLGGDVDVKSVVGEGSTFTVRLPLAPDADSRLDLPLDLPLAAGTVVLAIDDDPAVHDILTRTLGRRGIRVISAFSGAEGLAMARQLQPRAITLDVMMPGIDGWEVLAQLKADPRTAAIPVAMLTIVDGAARGLEAGAAAWLLKPIDRRKLVGAVSGLIGLPAEVLVVDDDDMLRELAVRTLRDQGCTVRAANSGLTALESMREHRPQLVLLDLMMPEMDGFQILEAMRADPALRDIPVVVLTAADVGADQRKRLGTDTPIFPKGKDPAAQIIAALGSATPMPAPARQIGR